jgi:hypothetical protein
MRVCLCVRGCALLFAFAGCGGNAAPEAQTPAPLPSSSAAPVAPPPVAVVDAGSPAVTVVFDTAWTSDNLGTQDPSNLALVVDFTGIRKHPDAARLGIILAATPQWQALLPEKADIIRDFDWVRMVGPSFINPSRDDIVMHHGLTDAVVDRGFDAVAKKRLGSATDLHVTGTKAWRVNVDRDDDVIIRAPSHIVAIVPAVHAQDTARDLVAHPPSAPTMHADEVMRVRAPNPGQGLAVIPSDISEMRLWVDAHQDGTADVYFEGDTQSEGSAKDDADTLRRTIQQKNSFAVRLMTEGLLNNIQVGSAGKTVRLRMHATQRQIEAVLSLAASRVNATLPPRSP